MTDCKMCGESNPTGMKYQYSEEAKRHFKDGEIKFLCAECTKYFIRIMQLATGAFNRYIDENPQVEGKMIRQMEFKIEVLKMDIDQKA